jgi:hypothetical protein
VFAHRHVLVAWRYNPVMFAEENPITVFFLFSTIHQFITGQR